MIMCSAGRALDSPLPFAPCPRVGHKISQPSRDSLHFLRVVLVHFLRRCVCVCERERKNEWKKERTLRKMHDVGR